MSSIRIVMDNTYDACYPGQTITGRVECNFDKQKNLRAVRIKFKGRAETEWYESERHYDHARKEHRSRRVRYYAEEPYLDAEYNLVQGGDNFSLGAGTHTYPFSYILPPQLPSSYEGVHGNVRYYIKATIDRPWKFDYEDKVAITVVSPLDLNYLPHLREPINISVDKTMCSCWCNDSGAMTFNMSLPATGFVPGQEISIGAHVENMTNVTAECVKFKIVEEIEFVSHYPSTKSKYEDSLVAACREGGIGAHGEKSWSSCITIPPAHLANLNPCSIINIRYVLKAKVVVPCPHTNLDSVVPITIGTIPLSGITTTFPGGPPPEMPFPLPSGPTSEGTPLLPNALGPYPGGAPPYPPGGNAPHPPGMSVPYPGGSAPYPSGGSAPYPPGGSAPYPPGGSAPYPPGGSAPYPPGGSAPYPPAAVPYPPGGISNGFGDSKNPSIDTKNPSAPPGDAAYPAGGAPYPPRSEGAPFGGATGPSAISGAPAPYPSGGTPYPSGAVPYSSAGAPYPPTSAPAADSFALPSYEDAQKSNEKSGKPE